MIDTLFGQAKLTIHQVRAQRERQASHVLHTDMPVVGAHHLERTTFEHNLVRAYFEMCGRDLLAAGDNRVGHPDKSNASSRYRAAPKGAGAMFNMVGIAVADSDIGRSEEHTSELQSLMRISYAVFCLKTKNKHTIHKSQLLSTRK